MRPLRRHLAALAGVWLLCQTSILGATSWSVCASTALMAAETCTCGHAEGAQCPMHHPSASKSNCSCRSTTDPGSLAMASLLGPIAIVPASTEVAIDPVLVASVPRVDAAVLDLSSHPEAPPPRA